MPANIQELALTVTVSGLVIVFLMLILLVILMKVFGFTMSRTVSGVHQSANTAVPLPQPTAISSSEDEDVIAVIAAAVASMYEGTGKRAVIRTIRPSSGSRSVWASAGIAENMRSFY